MFAQRGRVNESSEDVNPIPMEDRNKKPSSQFFLWFGSNLTIADFALGFIPIELGLNLTYTVIALAIGTLAGGALLASMSIMGPGTGLPQMMIGRHAFGKSGGKIMSVLQWVNTTGWLTVNTIIAASALAIMIGASYGYLYVLPVVIVALVVLAIVYFGHNAIHGFEKAMSVVLGILFLYLTVYSFTNYSGDFYYGAFSLVGLGTTVALSFSYIMSWGPYASDYSRYVRPGSRSVFWDVLAGSVISTIWVEIVGSLVALAIYNGNGEPASMLGTMLGRFADIGLIALVLGGFAANSLNLYSNSISLRSAGIGISRRTILLIITALSIILGIYGYSSFYSYYEDFLYVLDYWITPWLGIIIADYLLSRGEITSISPGYNVRTFIAYLVPIAISIPFIDPVPQLEGPISAMLGGVDISYFISFGLSMVFFYLLRRKDFRHRLSFTAQTK